MGFHQNLELRLGQAVLAGDVDQHRGATDAYGHMVATGVSIFMNRESKHFLIRGRRRGADFDRMAGFRTQARR